MKMGWPVRACRAVAGAAVLTGLVACMDSDTLYVEQPPWDEPAPGALGFFGYVDSTTKLTTCATCHPEREAEWLGTAHSDAWATLQASGHAADSCEPCHSVSDLGNATTNPNVGLAVDHDSRYQDVQCESCHGPGLLHVANPGGIKPLAPFEPAIGCGECHNGEHHPFVAEWGVSAHGLGPHTEEASSVAQSCMACHEGQTALEVTFGVDARFMETGDGHLMTITCVVCHSGHESPFPAQLRAPIDVPTSDHLCMKCHSRTGTPWSSHGPHAAQGPLIFGENVGYIPPGFNFPDEDLRNNHGPRNNPGICTTCHVAPLTITAANGDFPVQSVGHTFEAASCTDAQGLPVPGGDCAPKDRTFAACARTGCHGSELSAQNAYTKIRSRLNALLDELWTDTDMDRVLEASDGGVLPQVIALGYGADLDPSTSTVTPAKGAMWNAMLAWTDDRPQWSDGEVLGKQFSAHPSSGNGVHNPHLLEALLLASIGHVRDVYGVSPSPGFEAASQLGQDPPADPSEE